jgi:hypothetical protein
VLKTKKTARLTFRAVFVLGVGVCQLPVGGFWWFFAFDFRLFFVGAFFCGSAGLVS